VRAIAEEGHEIASHSYWHRRVTGLTREEFREDARASKTVLEDLTGARVVGYRAPTFSIVPGLEWAFDVLLEEGYRYDSSRFPISRPGYGSPGTPRVPYWIRRESGQLLEIPMATTTFVGIAIPAAGGGYLRHLPYALIDRGFKEASAAGVPAMFYLHPWEIDEDQPRLPVPVLTRIRHYRGLRNTFPRLLRLLRDHPFTSVMDRFPEVRQRSGGSVP
jgi:polysaccharide deacetylase family protein (PEP-CTERM system associated)